jgi:repressor LexA
LNEELIADGDFLLVEARHHAQSGETIVALINEQDTIVKRYHPDGDYIRLSGNNPHLLPIMLRPEDVEIQGVLVGLLRIF